MLSVLLFIVSLSLSCGVHQDTLGRRAEPSLVTTWQRTQEGRRISADSVSCEDHIVEDDTVIKKSLDNLNNQYGIVCSVIGNKQVADRARIAIANMDRVGLVLPVISSVHDLQIILVGKVSHPDYPDGLDGVSAGTTIIIAVDPILKGIDWTDPGARKQASLRFTKQFAIRVGELIFNNHPNHANAWKPIYENCIIEEQGIYRPEPDAFVSELAQTAYYHDFSNTIALCLLEPRATMYVLSDKSDDSVNVKLIAKLDLAMNIISDIVSPGVASSISFRHDVQVEYQKYIKTVQGD